MLLAGRKFVMEVLAIDSIEPSRFALRISCKNNHQIYNQNSYYKSLESQDKKKKKQSSHGLRHFAAGHGFL